MESELLLAFLVITKLLVVCSLISINVTSRRRVLFKEAQTRFFILNRGNELDNIIIEHGLIRGSRKDKGSSARHLSGVIPKLP